MPQYETIIVRTEDRVGVIQLNRPKAKNALNSQLMVELLTTLRQFDADSGVGCIVITGNDAAFAAGADIKEMAKASVVDMLHNPFISYWDDLKTITKPIIAAVSGWCLGGGCELAMACDMIVASENAKFGQPEINLGIIPGAGGTQRLTRAVGKALAMEIILNNRMLSAAEALQYKLINRVTAPDSYFTEAMKLATEIARRAPVAVRLGKQAINQAFETDLAEGVYVERQLFHMLFSTQDQKEGMAAFVEKREARWTGK
jgi:enoyl-CoA hydratase